jgi:ribose-phosphate pyrophosphokinase
MLKSGYLMVLTTQNLVYDRIKMITLTNNSDRSVIPYEILNFPDGESFIKLSVKKADKIVAFWKYESDSELFTLGLLFDVIKNNGAIVEELIIPYFPHARQDRATSLNQPFSLRVFLKFLKSIIEHNWVNIYTLDLHSDVAFDLTNFAGITNLSSSILATKFNFDHINCLVCPDKGAKTRVEEWAKVLNLPILYCEKSRDPSTGKLSNPTIVNMENLRNDWKYLLVDDIGTGFGTHIGLAKTIKSIMNVSIEIFVSHAGFSNGIEPILEFFDKVYTTNSVIKGFNKIKNFVLQKQNDSLKYDLVFVMPVENIFNLPIKEQK